MKKINSWYLPDSEEHLVKYIKRDDSYQKPHRDHALSFVKEFRGALDIGAHVGLWAKDLCRKFDMVYCFEPILQHRNCLRMNLVGNHNYIIHDSVLSDKEEELIVLQDKKSSGGTSFQEPFNDSESIFNTEELTPLCDGMIPIDFIKIDVEGMEGRVLKGGEKIILREKPIINIEQKFNIDGIKFLLSIGMELLGQYSDEYVFGFENG